MAYAETFASEVVASAYGGVLEPEHLRSVVRAALRAHGFTLSRVEFAAAVERQERLGMRLRDEALPARLPAAIAPRDFEAVARADGVLWERLPARAGLGYRHAEAFLEPAGTDGAEAEHVATLGAAFNAAIATLDHLVDERSGSFDPFEVITQDLVRWIFSDPGASEAVLAKAFAAAGEPMPRVLYALVAICAREGVELLRRNGNEAAWIELGETVERLFAAELRTADAAVSVSDLRTKSVEPSLAMLQIASLGSTRPPDEQAQEIALAVGRLFWLADDLVDLIDDSRQATPNALLARLGDIVRTRGAESASDADLYDVVDECALELVGLLGELAGSAPPATCAFARVTLASWAGWHEDVDVARAPAQRPGRATEAAAHFLLAQQRDGYSEAAHHLYFPRLSADAPRYETHPALLSFRAVALDALLDARDAGVDVPASVLNAEAIAILRAKHRHVRGGWNYVAAVPELPPDADDLGQVLQELVRIGGRPLASGCEEPIRLALDGSRPDGGFSTWIVDPRGRSPADDAVRAYLPVMGGWGVHPEVVANLLYGLLLYDPARYRAPLERGAGYLRAAQDPEGWWPSKWYAGKLYGTFKALSVLAAVSPGSSALARSRAFLLGARHADGGWGEGASDPLATAFALLSLAALAAVPPDAEAYLEHTQAADGGWASCPWIAFPTLDGDVTYGSRTMTTAFCLKALTAIGNAG